MADTATASTMSAASQPAFRPLEFIVTPETTYIIIADYDPLRRIFTDGRGWPKDIERSPGPFQTLTFGMVPAQERDK